MNIYEVEQAISEADEYLARYAEENGGEIPEVFEEALENLLLTKEKKIESVVALVKNKRAYIQALKDEKKAIDQRIEKAEKGLSYWVDIWLPYALDNRKFEGVSGSVSWRKSVSVHAPEIDHIPEKFRIVKTTVSADKPAIKAAIKGGEEVPGARLVEKNNIQIK